MKPGMVCVKISARLIFSLLFTLSLLQLAGGPAKPVHAQAVFTVTTELDYTPLPPNGVCWSGLAEASCGLREAIQEANNTTGGASIVFDPSMSSKVIALTDVNGGSLWITGNSITIDASTLAIKPIIDGNGLSANHNIIEIGGNNNVLRGVIVRGWADARTTNENFGNGIHIHDSSDSGLASNNIIDQVFVTKMEHNGIWIQGDTSGTGSSGNKITQSLIGYYGDICPTNNEIGGNGVYVTGTVQNNQISNNTIVCNHQNGIYLNGATPAQISGTVIASNMIGTDTSGFDFGNWWDGVHAQNTTLTSIQANIISGNNGYGVWLDNTVNSALIGNFIGIDKGGTMAVPNDLGGVQLSNGSNHNTLGSTTATSNINVISGNKGSGVSIKTGAHDNAIYGNYIGLNKSGLTAIPNLYAGIALTGANNNTIGASGAGTVKTYIAGNNREGIYAQNVTGLTVTSYVIIGEGVDSNIRPNKLEGIRIIDSQNASLTPLYVVGNLGAGIAIEGATTTGIFALPLRVYSNGGLPVDLKNDGHTANDAGDTDSGPNALLNYPEVTSSTSHTISGKACSSCRVYVYWAYNNPIASGGGGLYLSDLSVTANATGSWSFSPPTGYPSFTFIACQSSPQNCSEMSPAQKNLNARSVYLPLMRR